MWVFGKHGFTSAVAYDPKKDKDPSSPFKDLTESADTHVLVRARVKEDLEDLARVLPSIMIHDDPSADYLYRAVILRETYKEYMALCVDDITYDSHFKEAHSAAAKGVTYADRHKAVMETWSAMIKLQPHQPWSGGYGYADDYKAGSYTSATTKWFDNARHGCKDMDDFWSSLDTFPAEFSRGYGPRKGFVAGDRVTGFFGNGTVLQVDPGYDGTEMVKVQFDPDPSDTSAEPSNPRVFQSNFLIPEGSDYFVYGKAEAEISNNSASGNPVFDLEDVHELIQSDLIRNEEINEPYIAEIRSLYADETVEGPTPTDLFLDRLNSAITEDKALTVENVEDIYYEVRWENASDEKRRMWVAAADATVPEKYMHEAVKYSA